VFDDGWDDPGKGLWIENAAKFPAALKPYEKDLAGRSIIVRKAKPLPVECIVRGYLSGES